MFETWKPSINRRSLLKSSLAVLAGGAILRDAKAAEAAIKNMNQASSPSTLKITYKKLSREL
jgi:hypothetical protein